VTTIAIERGLVTSRPADRPGDGPSATHTLTLDAPAGQIRIRARVEEHDGRRRVSDVSFVNVPSFVLASAVPVSLGRRAFTVDVAFGGAFYAIVDAESAGLPMTSDRLVELRQAGMAIKRAVEATVIVAHPEEPGLTGIYGTIFTGPPSRDDAHLRNVTVFAEAEVDRSPCGTGTCAVLSVLDAMGLASADTPFVHESIIGTVFRARVVGRTEAGGRPAIVPELTGDAWITGEHTFLIDPRDPLAAGFRV
jgi:trans-L-3-hydroxyproline dehydratase